MSNRRIFEKLAAEENGFTKSTFLSPVLRGRKIRIRMAGVVMSLRIVSPRKFEGWGVFQPANFSEAKWVRTPSFEERSSYLNLFPKIRAVLSYKKRGKWFGLPVNDGGQTVGESAAIPIGLTENCQRFDQVVARFDGSHCWFDCVDPRRPPRIADELRACLREMVEPSRVVVAQCSQVERQVYASSFERQVNKEACSDERRIGRALNRGGGKYHHHREQEGNFVVTYEVDGEVHSSIVDKSNLAVECAGICLDGFDANFDLQSLVGVIREGQRTDQIWRE